jgi:hypothetical protein
VIPFEITFNGKDLERWLSVHYVERGSFPQAFAYLQGGPVGLQVESGKFCSNGRQNKRPAKKINPGTGQRGIF